MAAISRLYVARARMNPTLSEERDIEGFKQPILNQMKMSGACA